MRLTWHSIAVRGSSPEDDLFSKSLKLLEFSAYNNTPATMAGPDEVLDQAHRDILNRAVWNVLSTEPTLQACSQIADGLPLASVAFDHYGSRCEPSHPVARHTALCPGALETAWDFLSEFTLDTLDFDEKVSHGHFSG